MPERIVDRQLLTDLDEARDYDAASSYNYLNAELARLHSAIAGGAVVRVEEESGLVILASIADLKFWTQARYPHATLPIP